ncbi:MAG: twin-arginine translocation signal domain-containing protein [Chloroflexi bacterium]|nr:twin-arginine translocation signal domain-containing protein [Chloroflexota bacterium]
MSDIEAQKIGDAQDLSRRDFLKLSSLAIGALALPGAPAGMFEEIHPVGEAALDPQFYFQWQNDFLRKTIYPMREVKLRDFLVYYKEVDIWAQYKGRDINALSGEVKTYINEWQENAAAALKEYLQLRDYFLTKDVRAAYSNLQAIDEAEMAGINTLHDNFAQDWPRDIRGERSYVEGFIAGWVVHRDGIRDRIRLRIRRLEAMVYDHPKRPAETKQLEGWQTSTLPMAEQELKQLRAFLAIYDLVEERKLAWYRLSKNDPNFKTPEVDFLVKFPADRPITVRDLAHWKAMKYTRSLEGKNQYELLDEIYQRFLKEPRRFPGWLQYMVVHFSGMRYASAHGSWADPRDLIIRMSEREFLKELKPLDDAEIARRCGEKISVYESGSAANKPKLAHATEPEWTDKLQRDLLSVKSSGPKTRRAGLLSLLTNELSYELRSLPTEDVLRRLLGMKSNFPDWAWKEIVKLTTLRVTGVADMNWEKLTAAEEDQRYSQQSYQIIPVMDGWENYDPTAWRDEHGRTLELIVTKLVCNETAEHCQHVRGNLPPGGLAARPKWYITNETGNTQPGSYFVKPTSEKDYTPGASILWLRFVDSSRASPSEWNIARSIETKQKVGLLPAEFTTRNAREGEWGYRIGSVVTRVRATVTPDNRRIIENQWLRWIHEATVAEVAETADGMTVIAFETALPGTPDGSSAVGIFKEPLDWLLSDGTEDLYNRSFVGYVPEGQVPVEPLKKMLDWNKIFRRKVV